jgi:outer membrane protein
MKIAMKIVLAIAFVAFCTGVGAQQKPLKLAHIDSQELMQSMPEYDSAIVRLQKMQKEMEDEYEQIQVELRRKYDDYLNNQKNWGELLKTSREQEITSMQQRLQTFQESSVEMLQQENAKQMQPVREKANKAIEAVAKEHGITYVLESQSLYFKSADSQDILPLVQQYLGIKK